MTERNGLKRRMLRGVAFAALLALGACSKAEESGPPPPPGPHAEQAANNPAAGSQAGITEMAGVALSYSYSFRLPVAAVARAQEQHASQCDALAPRCRITGLEYHAGRNRYVSATLSVSLAPEIARRFGKQSVATVVGDGGMLSDSSITSQEAGATVASADRQQADFQKERDEIGRQLAKPGLPSDERVALQQRLIALRDAERETSVTKRDAALLLATTPMVLNYMSGPVDTGFGDGPILGAIKDGWANIVTGSAMLLELAITLIPWGIALVFVIWLVGFVRRRLGGV